MIVFRPIRHTDLSQFTALAKQANLGFYTLPKDVRLLEHRILRSEESFHKAVKTPESELYLFVAEDDETHEIYGVSAIAATTGGHEPLYFFRKEWTLIESHLPAVTKKVPILNPVSYVRGPSEVCGLFVLPQHRNTGVGRLLSLARFLFIARFPERFTNSLFAQLRGIIDESNKSPFWDGVCHHFFNKSFVEVHQMLEYGRSFVSHFLPKYPIYPFLLPKEVQAVIGQIDSLTIGAFNMLRKLGFEITDEIDLFDGGAKLSAIKANITAIKESRVLKVADIQETLSSGVDYLTSNEQLDFRACYCKIKLLSEDTVCLSRDSAQALAVGYADTIRVYAFHKEK